MEPHHSWTVAPVTDEARQNVFEGLAQRQKSEAVSLNQELSKGPETSKISEIHLDCVPVYDASNLSKDTE